MLTMQSKCVLLMQQEKIDKQNSLQHIQITHGISMNEWLLRQAEKQSSQYFSNSCKAERRGSSAVVWQQRRHDKRRGGIGRLCEL